MPIDPYTHNFAYRIGDGGIFIEGEIEFNGDKEVSYRLARTSQPLPHKAVEALMKLVSDLKSVYEETGGIKYILLREKGYNP